ncbi:MAG: metalloregulator ArsR/SmtB family transcription factor [Thermoanaerobaculia bacterium]|nr:metalloregulator ArsR/SmtB family transcription factor [Thermoanaerobaculia bacterium]
MPRATTNSDVFNAVAEGARREILSWLAGSERSVSEITDALDIRQPSVSKHLKVLHEVGLVSRRRDGRRVLYSVNAEEIRPLYEWADTFSRLWRHQLGRIKERAEQKRNTEKGSEE